MHIGWLFFYMCVVACVLCSSIALLHIQLASPLNASSMCCVIMSIFVHGPRILSTSIRYTQSQCNTICRSECSPIRGLQEYEREPCLLCISQRSKCKPCKARSVRSFLSNFLEKGGRRGGY